MDFSLREEQADVQGLARKILEEQVDSDFLREIEQGSERYDPRLWKMLADAGLLGIAVAEENGGMGFDFETLCLLVEECGRTLAPVPTMASLVYGALPVQEFGSDEQKTRLLPGLVGGELLLSAGLAEPGSDDPLSPVAEAVRKGDGWNLTGVKHGVPFARSAERVLVGASLEGGGVGLFLVDPKGSGVQLTPQQVTTGEPQDLLRLENAPVAAADVLVEDGEKGREALRWLVERATAAGCSQALGIAEKMMWMTASYATEREQFGVKIATFQAVGHRAANCFIDVQCLRLSIWQAVSCLSHGMDASREVQTAKAWVGDVLHRVSYASQHLHGGTGVDRDYALFRYCLWAKQVELTLGSSAETLARLGASLAKEYQAAV